MPTNNAINTTFPFPVANGGTGSSTLTDHGVLVGAATNPLTSLAVGSTGTLCVGSTGSDPSFATSSDGNFSLTSATPSTDRTLTVSNTDNTGAATSAANLQITVGGGNVSDPRTTYTVTGAQSFTAGIDNSSSDSFKIAASTALGTTDTAIITSAGEVTLPLQPAFLGVIRTTDSNVTGNSTLYTVGTNVAYTEIFDIGSDFATNGIFTAPRTGKYYLASAIRCNGFLSVSSSANIRMLTSNNDFRSHTNPGPIAGASESLFLTLFIEVFCDMDAGDTARVQIEVSRSSGTGDTVDISVMAGGNDQAVYFCGNLFC